MELSNGNLYNLKQESNVTMFWLWCEEKYIKKLFSSNWAGCGLGIDDIGGHLERHQLEGQPPLFICMIVCMLGGRWLNNINDHIL